MSIFILYIVFIIQGQFLFSAEQERRLGKKQVRFADELVVNEPSSRQLGIKEKPSAYNPLISEKKRYKETLKTGAFSNNGTLATRNSLNALKSQSAKDPLKDTSVFDFLSKAFEVKSLPALQIDPNSEVAALLTQFKGFSIKEDFDNISYQEVYSSDSESSCDSNDSENSSYEYELSSRPATCPPGF